MKSLARAGLTAFWISTRLRVVSIWSYLNWLVFPMIFATVGLFVLSRPGASSPHLVYGILGGGLIGYWSTAYLDGANGIQQERWSGTLEQIFAVPTPLWVILLGKILGSLLFGVLSFLPTVAFAYVGFHAVLPSVDPLPFVISLAVLTFSFMTISFTLTPLFALWRWAFTMLNGFELGVYILCGFMFPIALLAPWAQGLAALLAPTWGVRALYGSTLGASPQELAEWWLACAGLSCLYLVGAYFAYRMVGRRARISGDLALA
jgi:ABC-2 type transport system permease protein